MTEKNPAYVLQNRTDHKSDAFRLMLSGLTGRAEGVFGLSDLAVTQDTGSNMNSRAAVGGAFMFGDESITQGLYAGYNDAAVNLTHGAAPGTPGQTRYDLVCARVRDQVYSGATNAWDLYINAGAGSASPVDPTMAPNTIALARVSVAFGQTTVTNANITDLRPRVPFGIAVVNSGRRPGILYGPLSPNALGGPAQAAASLGMVIAESDTYKLLMYTTATTGWQPPWNLPWGRLAFANSNGTSNVVSNITTETVVLTSSAITVPANRIMRISAIMALTNPSGSFYATPRIRRGTTIGGTLIQRGPSTIGTDLGFGVSGEANIVAYDTGASGSTQWVLTIDTSSGVEAAQPYMMAVEDMGPAANPA